MFFFGDNYYGQVDRVRGLFFVRTRFLHIWFVPLIPRESYLFFDEQPDGQYIGVRIPLNWKSVFVAWMRGFLLFFAVIVLLGAAGPFESDQLSWRYKFAFAALCLGMAVLACIGYLWTLRFSRPTTARAVAHGAVLHIPGRVVEEYLQGNSTGFWRAMSEPGTTAQHMDSAEMEAIRAAVERKKADGSFITKIKDGQS